MKSEQKLREIKIRNDMTLEEIEENINQKLFNRVFECLDKDYVINRSTNKKEIVIGYDNIGVTKIKFEFPRKSEECEFRSKIDNSRCYLLNEHLGPHSCKDGKSE